MRGGLLTFVVCPPGERQTTQTDRLSYHGSMFYGQHDYKEGGEMSGVRVLVGTHKGAFVLTADGKRDKWDVSGPHFAGWEIYHMKGSPVDPNRLYASQTSGWFGQLIQRSNDGGKT
jgi:hypothetical protein